MEKAFMAAFSVEELRMNEEDPPISGVLLCYWSLALESKLQELQGGKRPQGLNLPSLDE